MRTLRLTALLSALALVALALPVEAGDRGSSRRHRRGGGHVYVYPSHHWSWGFGWGWGPYWWGGPGWGSVYMRGDARYRGRFAVVDTDVEPEEAEVFLDGAYVGTADDFDGHPDFLYLSPGTYRLEFRHPGYENLSREIEVSRGERIHVDQEMRLAAGRRKLEFSEPTARKGVPMGRVFGPGGKPVTGRDRDSDEEADRSRERDRDRVGRWDGDDDDDQGVAEEDVKRPESREAAPREVERVPDARPERARVRFEVKPQDAAVYVDDRYEGSGDELSGRRGILLEAGRRTVTVVRPGYQPKTVEVEAKAGQTVDVVVELAKP
jgi:hypothetical protein